MNQPLGMMPLGVVYALPDLSAPSTLLLGTLAEDLTKRGISHRLLVTRTVFQVPCWRNLAVGDVPHDEAVSIAARHSRNCETLVVLDGTTPLNVLDSNSSPVHIADGKIVEHTIQIQPTPFTRWAPVRDGPSGDKAWGGAREVKPWDFDCEVTIPVLDAWDTLPMVIELLRAQSIRPFISIVDCGSIPEQAEWLEALRADDLEIHTLRFNGVRHSSDFPAASLDLAMSICRSEVLVTLHVDVFLRQQTSLQQLVELCGIENPAVGFGMTPRDTPGWENALTHSFSAFHMPTMDAIGAGWSLRRAARLAGIEDAHRHHGPLGQFMDTETCMALVMQECGMKPLIIATEANFEMTIHPLMRHTRTLVGSRLYCPAHRVKAEGWLAEALAEGAVNLAEWKGENA